MGCNWEDLPLPALVGIFTRLPFRPRLAASFSVCPSWSRAADDPRCWQSMFAAGASPEECFIKVDSPSDELPLDRFHAALGRGHAVGTVAPIDVDFAVDDGKVGFGYCEVTSKVMTQGVGRLKKLVKLSQGRIESLCLSPFLAMEGGRPNDDQLLAFISENCPNLKHLSLRGSLNASEAAMKKLFQSCNKLELLDFSYAPCFTVPVLRELGSCCRGIRGIRRRGSIKYVEANAIASHLPNLRLLNLAETFLDFDGLSAIASGCNGLEFFDVTGSWACDLYAMEGAHCPIQELPMEDHEECVFGEDATIVYS